MEKAAPLGMTPLLGLRLSSSFSFRVYARRFQGFRVSRYRVRRRDWEMSAKIPTSARSRQMWGTRGLLRICFFRPYGTGSSLFPLPRACALGCILAPLRGCSRGGAYAIGRSRQKSPRLAQRTREKWGTRIRSWTGDSCFCSRRSVSLVTDFLWGNSYF